MSKPNKAAQDLIDRAEQLTPDNMKRYLRGLPMKARAVLKAAIHLPAGSLTVQMPDGRIIRVGGENPGPDAVVVLNNWNLPRRAFLHGTIGVGESYMDGDWTSPDVTTFLKLFLVNEDLGNQVSTTNGFVAIYDRIRHWLRRNTKSQAQKNIAAHYDLGNAFYEKWLDRTMTYSAAVFSTGANDLASAQNAKYRKLATATGITADDHVLEIGCGWGGFAEFAAREIGCNVTCLTISREQFDYARERIRNAGLADKVTIKFQDYRDEQGTYDKVVSIEMFEAVGEEFWETYFDKLNAVLKPGGQAGIQTITINERSFDNYRKHPDFIQRYVFPGGMLPTPQIMENLGNAHNLITKDTFYFPHDYADTLAAWRKRFWDAWPAIQPLGFDDRFKRLWEFYMYYCEAGFRSEFIDVRQLVYAKAR